MPQVDRYPPWVGLVYIFNLIVGTGALTLPAAFAAAGWLFSTFILMFLAFVSFITVTFVIESIACANATLQWRKIQLREITLAQQTRLCANNTTMRRLKNTVKDIKPKLKIVEEAEMPHNEILMAYLPGSQGYSTQKIIGLIEAQNESLNALN
ncbi:hypothetical protein JTB14_007361 [Gonioctena quinquepunctata]|nr:hypothetical protein JTB14_007361 [Gonioctena quinquepunctata]